MLRFLTAHGFANIAPLQGWYDYEGQLARRHARRRPALLPRRRRRLGAGARRRSRATRDEFLERLGEPRRGHRRSCTPCSPPTPSDPAFAPEEPSQRVAVAADRDDRRGHRADLRAAARRRARGADRRPRPGRARAARDALPDRRRRPRDPHPRRLPPRPDPAHAGRLGDHRLRGRAGAPAARAPPEALAAARRRRHAALVRLRHLGRRAPARAAAAPADFEERARERVPRATTSATSTRRCCPPARRRSPTCSSIFELEKAIYELQYELDNRPDWLPIPVAGIVRLLESE